MRIGYARVSTDDQSLEVQIEQLNAAGCVKERIFRDQLSGKDSKRLGLQAALKHLESGIDPFQPRGDSYTVINIDGPHVLVVTKLDRLARNTRDLLEILERIGKAGASFVSFV
jgi:DNA invertase Pin-like site-specific DNA recombinase